jgi:catechol 2,3-dioxygenase-like lactoylglutathione lyase family enzyme
VDLDDGDAALDEQLSLVTADQPSTEDDGEIGRDSFVCAEWPRARIHLEARSFELRYQRGLSGREQEDVAAVRPHGGMIPAEGAFKALVVGIDSGMNVKTLDHVALWVAERDRLTDFLCGQLGMHVIERTDAFTLVGVDARRGKLTLFAAEGPRDPGVLGRIAVRVPAGAGAEVPSAPDNMPVVAVESDGEPYDIDHVAFHVPAPDAAFAELATLGFAVEDGRLRAGDASIDLVEGDPGETDRPLLNHLGLLVESVDRHIEEAERRGLQIDEVRDAANTYSLFLSGPGGIKLEYVEHKSTFSLA